MGFETTKADLPLQISFEDIFEKIIIYLPLKQDDPLIEKIKSNVLPYYSVLYKETLVSLLNFSDSYYRFIKNQHLGILTLDKILA